MFLIIITFFYLFSYLNFSTKKFKKKNITKQKLVKSLKTFKEKKNISKNINDAHDLDKKTTFSRPFLC